ncbi:hypothetical protein KGQ25_02540 [Patescibacteria group bacterium]|nr:hypothetical protein [Patescibacteria group bacterium]MDE2021727.1 hypothetical protein [Patescibacteria group bacterium]
MESCFISDFLDRRFAARARAYEGSFGKVFARFDTLVAGCVKKTHAEDANRYKYKLDFSASRRIGRRMLYPEIYFETASGFVLCVHGAARDIPIAVIGFEKKSKRLVIRQLQGVKGAKEYLCPLHWERLLYRAVILFGRELKLEAVHVLPACQSPYHPFGNPEAAQKLTPEECEVRAQRMHLVYDREPVRCGFKWCENTRTFAFTLSQ